MIWRRLSQSGICNAQVDGLARCNLIIGGVIVCMYHAIIGPRLATERHRGLRNPFVDDTVGEHRLRSDPEDKAIIRVRY